MTDKTFTVVTAGADFARDGLLRGDYMRAFAGQQQKGVRILRVSPTVLTVRDCHRFRAIEWTRARVEDWLLWPLADLKAKMRVRDV